MCNFQRHGQSLEAEKISTFQQHLSMGILMLNMRRPLSRDISLETTGAKFRSKLSFWAEIERNQDFATCVSTVGSYQCLKAKREIIYSNYLEDNKMSLFCELIWFLWNNSCLFMSRWDYFLHSLSLLLNVLKSSTKKGAAMSFMVITVLSQNYRPSLALH